MNNLDRKDLKAIATSRYWRRYRVGVTILSAIVIAIAAVGLKYLGLWGFIIALGLLALLFWLVVHSLNKHEKGFFEEWNKNISNNSNSISATNMATGQEAPSLKEQEQD